MDLSHHNLCLSFITDYFVAEVAVGKASVSVEQYPSRRTIVRVHGFASCKARIICSFYGTCGKRVNLCRFRYGVGKGQVGVGSFTKDYLMVCLLKSSWT